MHTQITARITLSRGAHARVSVNNHDVEAIITGTLETLPVTGDWTTGRLLAPDLFLIETILPRRTHITRRAAGRRSDPQVLAANVDLAFLVCGLDNDFNLRRIERYLAICHEGNVAPVIVLNKTDLCPDLPSVLDHVRQVAHSRPVVPISAKTGANVDQLRSLLTPTTTAVLLGSSGAGKSSLLNRLLDAEIHTTNEVRESDSRGRHTTTDRELIPLPNGAALIDTPGLREIQLLVSEETVEAVFDEIAALSPQCRFADCTHTSEPDCAVRDAVPEERLTSFQKLTREAARHTNPLTEKQRWRAAHKTVKRFYKERGR